MSVYSMFVLSEKWKLIISSSNLRIFQISSNDERDWEVSEEIYLREWDSVFASAMQDDEINSSQHWGLQESHDENT